MREFFIAVLPALLSSFLTAIFMKENDDKKREADIANNRRILAKALYSELIALMELYGKKDDECSKNNMKVSPEPPKHGKDIKIAYISQKYVSVYESQLGRIGLLNEDDIPHIIGLYTCIKGLIDSHIYLAKRWEMYAQYTREPNKIQQEEAMKKEDVNSAHRAVYMYQEKIYDLYPDVLNRLKEYDTAKED